MNIILYVMDCLRADHVGVLGYGRNTTPVLDRLAAEGIVFSRAYAQSGWTAPSAASLFSGQYPGRTGIRKMRDPLNREIPWLPEILRSYGYKTAGFSGVYQVSRLRGFDRGFNTFRDVFKDPEAIARCRARGQDTRGNDYCLPLSEDLHIEALRWLDEHAAGGDDFDPFFMLIWSIDTHEPFRQPEVYNIDADPAYAGPVDGRGRPFSRVRNRRDLQHLIDLYDGSLRYQDEKLGEFLQALGERDLLDETLIVIMGDHGEMFFEHGVAGHGKFPWEEELTVPLIMRYPQALPQGGKYEGIVQLIDVAPTVLDIAGFEEEPRFCGRSLRPIFEEERDETHEAVLLEIPFPFHEEECARVVRTREWKYIEYDPPDVKKRINKFFKELGRALTVPVRPGMLEILYGDYLRKGLKSLIKSSLPDLWNFLRGRPICRLYHLADDPQEQHDRFSTEKEQVGRLRSYFTQLDAASRLEIGTSQAAPSTEEEARIAAHLAQLGYIEE